MSDNFVEEVRKLSKPEENKKQEENRQAIRFLALQISELREEIEEKEVEESEAEPSDSQGRTYQCNYCGKKFNATVKANPKHHDCGERKEEKEEFECRVCGKAFPSKRKRNGHEGGAHTIEDRKEKEEETKQVTPEKKLERFESGEKISDSSFFNIEERVDLTKKLLSESEEPMTRQDLAVEMYNLNIAPESASPHYNAIHAVVKKLKREDKLQEVKKEGKTFYSLSSSLEEQEETEEEKTEMEKAIERLEEIDSVDSGVREFDSYVNALDDAVPSVLLGEKVVSYYDFAGCWGGDQSAKDAWETFFSVKPLQSAVREEVAPEKDFNWSSERGNSVKSWNLTVKK